MAAEQPLPAAAAAAVESQAATQPAPSAEVPPARVPPPAPPPQQQAVSAEGQPPGRLASISETAEPAARVQLPLADGEHHVRFADGSQFYGEVQGGSMHGRGIFVWRNGDRYEGGWQRGYEDGSGTFLASDGSSFFGTWKQGQLDGQGVYKPAVAAGDPRGCLALRSESRAGTVLLREYRAGALVGETVLRMAEKDVGKKEKKAERRKAKRAYQPPKPGERIYKGHASYRLMRELQLGIMYSIAQASQEEGIANRSGELREGDFQAEAVQFFPAGSETEPFKWKNYSPRAFHRLRQAFGIDNRDYLLSITGMAALRELPSPGKSGSVFFLSDDDRFLIKTVRKEEMRLLLDTCIARYYRHVQQNPGTLLTHFYGVHRVSPVLGRQVRFVVMGNVLPSDLRLHRKYDLKGSTWKRSVGEARRRSDPHATLKDMDLDMQLVLSPEHYGRVMRQLERDCRLLEELRVIDYSLLLGVHFQTWGNFRWAPPGEPWPDVPQVVLGDKEGLVEQQRRWQRESGEEEAAAGPTPTSATATAAASAAGEGPAEPPSPSQHLQDPTAATEGEGATPVQRPAGVPPRLWMRRTGSEGVRSLLAMLQQPPPNGGAGGEPELLRAAAAVIESAQSSGKAARQMAALARCSVDSLPAAAIQPPSIDDSPAAAAAPSADGNAGSSGHSQGAAAAALHDCHLLPAGETTGALPQPPPLVPAAPALHQMPSQPRHTRGASRHSMRSVDFSTISTEAETMPSGWVSPARTSMESHPPRESQAANGGPGLQQPPPAAKQEARAPPAAPKQQGGVWACGMGWLCATHPPAVVHETPEGAEGEGPPARRWEPDLPAGGSPRAAKPQAPSLAGPPSGVSSQSLRLLSLAGRGAGAGAGVGQGVPATAVRRGGGCSPQPVLLYFGVIDFLQDYTLRKRLEHAWKVAAQDASSVSVADPRFYRTRFMAAMQRLFVLAPDP